MTDTPTRELGRDDLRLVDYGFNNDHVIATQRVTDAELLRMVVVDGAMIERAAEVVADETPSTYSQKRVFEIAERVLRAALEVTGGQ